VAGPYLVILLASSLGAYYRLSQRGETSRWKAVAFFLAINATACLVTVPASMLADAYTPRGIEASWLFGPVAFGIGLVGERWPAVLRWMAGRVQAKFDVLLDAVIKTRTGGGDGR
jgi:hypothetical protein